MIQALNAVYEAPNNRIKHVKKVNNPVLKPKRVIHFVDIFTELIVLKRELKLSADGLILIMAIAGILQEGKNVTTSKLVEMLYEQHSRMRSMQYRLGTLIRNGNVYRIDNKYYLTDKAVEAINRIAL